MSDDPTQPSEPPAVNGGFIVPSHGRGRLRPFQAGQSGNPAGLSGRYGEVVRLAREASPEAMRAMIEIMRNPDEETRARIVAIEGILNRAYGRPRDMKDEAPAPIFDANKMSERQLKLAITALRLAREVGPTPPAEPEGESTDE